MHIKVFGPGCARCTQVEKLVQAVVAEKANGAMVEKVTDLQKMMALGIMSTPALVIDEKVICTGRIPTKDEISGWIDQVRDDSKVEI